MRESQVLSVCSGEEQNIRNIQSRTRNQALSVSNAFKIRERQQTSRARSRNQVLAHSNRSAFRYDPQIDYAQQSSVQIGDMNKICPKCSAKNGSMKLMACAVLLEKTFNAHINVEYCHSVQAIKYICKYINKGSDQATFGVRNPNDEVENYVNGRYISTSEAAWRIFEFPIHERHPTVLQLAVHLENGQRVYFTTETAVQVAQNPRKTTLLAF
ncbi:hypothetical protein EVAR_37286_1 [Eumeta japonica]|uniref:Uncharacterized protein n=1 Tax=Eumeta variegata TaxID=151549 RepID=A0A4C1WKS4_EUMVA|nr:hypothetical protein EVAR_37286_1 [Eumeta japonica]